MTKTHTIPSPRPAERGDLPDILAVAQATGLFDPGDLPPLRQHIEEALAETSDAVVLVAAGKGTLQGVTYGGPMPFSGDVWNLWFIGVHPAAQGSGIGRALVEALIQALQDKPARLLLVETSSGPELAAARRFYPAIGFAWEARIRGFYGPEEDKLIFSLQLKE